MNHNRECSDQTALTDALADMNYHCSNTHSKTPVAFTLITELTLLDISNITGLVRMFNVRLAGDPLYGK